MKKLLFLLTIILVLLVTSAAVSAENGCKVYLTPGYGTAECYRTQEIQLVLKAQDVSDLYTAQFEISYDPTRLELNMQSIQNLAWPDSQNGYTGIQLNAESGKLKVIFSKMSTCQGTSGNIDIMSLKFKTKVIGQTRINIDDVNLVNSNGEYIDGIQASGYEVNVLPNPLYIVLSGTEGNDGWYNSNVQVKVTDIDAAKVEYLLNGTYGLYSSEFTISDSGFYKLTVTTDDGYGYIKKKSVEFKIDNIKPTAALLSEAKKWQNTDISVVPSYSDAGYSSLKESKYKWSNDLDIPSEWNDYAGGSLVQTHDGIWYLHMKAVDGAGNVAEQTYGPYGIDRIAPSLSIEPAESDWDNTDVIVTPLYADKGGSNIKSAVYSWRISPDTNSSLDNHTVGDIVQSQDGVWYLYMKVEDNAGNVTESAYGPYKVDKTPPVITAVPNTTEWTNYDVVIEPQCTDGNGSGTNSVWYEWSSSESTPSSWEEFIAGPLTQTQEGVWYLHMKANDNTGNEAVYTFGPYKLDKTAPTITADMTARETWENTDVNVIPAYIDEGGSQIESISYSWSISQDMPSEWKTYTSGSIELSQDGEWFLHLMAEDNAGNTTTVSYGPYRVDKLPPVITHSFTEEYTYLDTINLGYTAIDETSGIAGSSISINGITCDNGADVQLVWPGSCNIEITAQDLAGNTATVIKTISIVVQAEVDVNPNSVNAKENGNGKGKDTDKDKDNGGGMITVYIEFPEGVDINDIIHGTIRLNGVYSPISDTQYGFVGNPVADHDGDGRAEYMIKFRRDDIIDELVRSGGSIIISGSIGSYDFRGVDLVDIKN